ncbi:MAG: hypothetical protein IJ929_11025 [Prevotella sp.]|nr:hypothetical protein [Prevotella sp.]
MNTFKKSIVAGVFFFLLPLTSCLFTSCSDANEYEDAYTDNPSWTKSETIAHPETLASTKWVRGSGLKVNAFGQEVQGFVESLNFATADSVSVKMSQGATEGTWTDESNTEAKPYYEYNYSASTGRVEILKLVRDDKGNISKSAVFVGIATSDGQDIITIAHYGDTPVQTYLVKQ